MKRRNKMKETQLLGQRLFKSIKRKTLVFACVLVVMCFLLGNDYYNAKAFNKEVKQTRAINFNDALIASSIKKRGFMGTVLQASAKEYIATEEILAGGDVCPGTAITALPYNDPAGTTIGLVDNYNLPADTVAPTATGCPTCTATGTGPAGSLPRGASYTGTGTGPDSAYTITFTSAGNSLNVTMDPTAQDMAVIVYTNVCSSLLTDAIVISDAGIAGAAETVSISAMPAGTYNIVVDGYSTGGTAPGPSDTYTLAVTGSGTIGAPAAPTFPRSDFDGDGKTDLSVFRPSEGVWYLNQSTAGNVGKQWGVASDRITPGDFDGDNKTDLAVFRPSAAAGVSDFYILNSNGNVVRGAEWGTIGDLPVVADYDGDNKDDVAIYRPSTNDYFVIQSSNSATRHYRWGVSGDIPVPGDFDGDLKAEFAVFRPSNGTWYYANSTGGAFVAVQYGATGDIPVFANYDTDTKDDIAVYRPSNGTWYLNRSLAGSITVPFGATGDIPVPGDYDGDGRYDVAIYRAGVWYINQSTAGIVGRTFGTATDNPTPRFWLP
jgi:FG-GAP-like repeat